MRRDNYFEWTDAAIERLRELWAEGLPTLAIGRAMGISKNAVVGRARRLRLPPRPSPIKGASVRPPKPPRAPRDTLPPLPSIVIPTERYTAGGRAIPLSAGRGSHNREPSRAATLADVAAAGPQVRRIGPVRECSWVTTAGRPWAYCNAPTEPGCSYCTEHAAMAYVKRREPAALVAEPGAAGLVFGAGQ
jgi:GcrA cell cycle regulator